VEKVEICRQEIPERWVTVLCGNNILDRLEISLRSLPSQLQSFARGSDFDEYHAMLPVKPAMVIAVNDLINNNLNGAYRSLYVEGKILELLSLTISQLDDAERGEITPASLSAREINRVEHSCHLITSNLASPPSLAELSRTVGLSSNRLNELFRAHMGVTTGQYAIEQRMLKAHDLLKLGDMSITEIGYELGYKYPGNFTAAFKRFFGVPPRNYRPSAGS
jgi:AraC-like DNA-binding protein